nr:putative beta-lysine N-acetyltransferase [Bacillus benzoevorans]
MMEVYLDPYNKRVRVDDYRGNISQMIEKAEEQAALLQAEKLIVIGRREDFSAFLEHGYLCEAMVDRFFHGSDAYYFTKYFVEARKLSHQWLKEDAIVRNVGALTRNSVTITPPQEYDLVKVNQADAENLAVLYKKVFQIYPVPLHDPDYIRKTMEQGTIYYAYLLKGNVVSAASAEINSRYYHAEMTDCATLLEHRKFGLMKQLLIKLIEELVEQGIFCAYSIARAQSFGMNAVLHQLGFEYRGRLLNNCYIYDKLENMNMWIKDLSSCHGQK